MKSLVSEATFEMKLRVIEIDKHVLTVSNKA